MLAGKLKRQLLSHIWLARIAILVLTVLLCFLLVFIASRLIFTLADFSGRSLSQTRGRTNFLILGVGGPGHEAPDLTDTIILASLDISTGQTTLISVPRDIWVPSLRAKINSAYHYGQLKQPDGGGLIMAKSAVSEIINQPVHYALILNFSSFEKFIDALGGIDVEVTRSFTDTRYPLPGKEDDPCGGDPEYLCRYETVSFPAGITHMDGSTALKFTRSRYSESLSEGTDYARSQRQAQVIKAVQVKLLTLARDPRNLSRLKTILTDFSKTIITDIPDNSRTALIWLAFKARGRPLATYALTEPDHLYHPPLSPLYDNQWVLIPKDNQPQIIFDYVSSLLE